MSITLPVVDLSAAVVNTSGTVSWVQQTGGISSQATNDNRATLWIFNESGCGLQLSLQSGDRPFLPAGGWIDMQLTPNCLQYSYSVSYVMTGAQVNSLITVWFAPGETVPNVPRLGNSPIGGSVSNNVANILEGIGQTFGLTEQDVTIGVQSGGPNLYPATQGEGLYLSSNASGTPSKSIHIRQDGNLDLFLASVVFYNGSSPLAGQGLVPIVAAVKNFQVTTTGLKTVLTFTVGAADGLFRINWSVKVSNAISGNNITAQVAFTDGGAGQTRFLNAAAGGGATNTTGFIGSNSIVNAWYPGLSEMILAQANTAITISYNDPTNTPNDFVSAVIEQLL